MRKLKTSTGKRSLLDRTRDYMLSHQEFKTPLEITAALGISPLKIGTISSRLREIHAEGYNKDREHRTGQVYAYRITCATDKQREDFEARQQHQDDYTHPDNK